MSILFIDIDYNKIKNKAKYYLAKPNKQITSPIYEKFNDSISLKLGNIDELSFSIPHNIEKDFEMIYNEHVDTIKEKMLIKMELGTQHEWFIVDSIEEDGDNSDTFNVTAFSLGYELSHKRIPVYNKETIKCQDLLNDLLENTVWTIGTIDPKFTQLVRSFDVTDSNVLDCIIQVSETFGALIIWDTINRKISFTDINTFGSFKGMSVDYGKLLRSIKRSRTSDELVTRLYVYGSEDLSIHNINPTGQGYLEDFSFFLYPFQRDSNKNVIKSSNFMSDALCNSLLDYENLLTQNAPQIRSLLDQKITKTKSLSDEQIKADQLDLDMETLLDRLDVAKANEDSTLIVQLTTEKDNKQIEINNENAVINQLNTDIANISTQLNNIQTSLQQSSNFTPVLLDELNLYIIEKVWRDDRYIDANDLYNDAVSKFNEMKQPKVVVTIDIEDLFEIIDEQYYWDKLVLGDSIKVKYPQMKMEYLAKIIQIDYNVENSELQVTIANTTDIGSDMDKLKQILYSSQNATSILQNNKYKWDNVTFVQDDVYQLLNNEWNATKQKIVAGVNNKVEIGKRGITVTNPDDPNEVIIINSGVIALSSDGGETWKTAIKPDGVVAERIVGNIIAGRNLVITNGTQSFTFDENGVKINGSTFEITGGLPSSQLDMEDLQSKLTTSADSRVDDMLSDMKLTSIEKEEINRDWQAIKSEYTQLSSLASSLRVSYSNYQTAYDNLNGVSPKIETDVLVDMTTTYTFTSTIDRDNFNKKIVTYYNEAEILNKSITDTVQNNASTAQMTASSAQASIGDMLNDMKITSLEKIELSRDWESVKAEYTQLSALATSLSVSATTYTTAYNNMDGVAPKIAIDILSNMTTTYTFATFADRDNFKNKFTTYYSESQKLSKAISDKIQSTANSAQTTANSAMSNVNDMLTDMKVTPIEKNQLSRDWEAIKAQYSQLITLGNSLSVLTTTFTTAYNNLDGTSPKIATDILANMTATYSFATTTDRDNFKTKITTYYTESQKLSKAISDEINTTATSSLQPTTTYNGVKIDGTNGITVTSSKNTLNLNASKGLEIKKTSDGSTVLSLDSSTGNATFTGNITMTGGSITWGNVSKPTYSSTELSNMGAVSSSSPQLTYIDSAGIYTGTLSAGQIYGGTISGVSISGVTFTASNGINFIGSNSSVFYDKYGNVVGGPQSDANSYWNVQDPNQNTALRIHNGYGGDLNVEVSRGLIVNGTANLRSSVTISGQLNTQAIYGTYGHFSGNLDVLSGVATANILKSDFHDGQGTGIMYIRPYSGNEVRVVSIGSTASYESLRAYNLMAQNSVYAKGVNLGSSVIEKTNIAPYMDDATDVLKSVNIYKYHFKSDVENRIYDNEQIGALAQTLPITLRGSESDTVNPYAMISVLWKVCQEQQDNIELLEKNIKDLENVIEVICSELNNK